MLTITEGPSSGDISVQLIIIVILTLLNAFLAASELAILSSNPTRIKMLADKGNKKAILVQKLKENETKFLSTIQVGITLSGFFSSATAAVTLSEGFAIALEKMNVLYASQIALIVTTLILSYFTLVFGELFPKRIALKSPEKIALAFAKPINFIRIIFKPIVLLLSGSCELLVKIFRLKPNKNDKVTQQEVQALVSTGVEDGTINSKEEELINAVFTFNDLIIKDVMKPRIDVFMIDIDESISKIKKSIKQEKYTRIPVYQNTKDNIIGIINIKDIFLLLKSNYTVEDLKNILRKPIFVSESMKAESLLYEFQKKKEHSAIVIDEAGSVSGYITLEDLIEEITGNIYDEYDEETEGIEQLDESTYRIDGAIPIQDLNRKLNLNIEKDTEQYSSMAGYITYELKNIPKVNDEIILKQNIHCKIIEIKDNRITKIEIKLL